MNVFSISVLGLFFALSIFHLFCSFCQYLNLSSNFKKSCVIYADYTKPVLLPVLCLFAILTLLNNGTTNKTVLILCGALFFGAVGDFILLNPLDKKYFVAGTLSFLAGHICFLCLLTTEFFWQQRMLIYTTVISGIFSVGAWLLNGHKKGPSGAVILVYGFILFVQLSSGIQNLVNHESFGIFQTIGGALFIVSDGVLSFTLFTKDFKFSRFLIMLTYLLAEMFLTFAVINL